MNKALLCILSLLLLACGGSGSGNKDTEKPGIKGTKADPCVENNICTNYVEITSVEQAQRRATSNTDKEKYHIGRTYISYHNKLINNIDYDKGRYVGNCYITYKEEETLYKVRLNVADRWTGRKVDELISKYKRYDYKLLTQTPSCKVYMQDKLDRYSDEDKFQLVTYHEDKEEIDFEEALKYYRVFLLNFKGIPVVRFEDRYETESTVVHSEVNTNGDGERTLEVKGKTSAISMELLSDKFPVKAYDYFTFISDKGDVINDSVTKLLDIFDGEIDLDDLPERYKD